MTLKVLIQIPGVTEEILMEREEETEGRREGGETDRQRSLGCRKQLIATNRNNSNNESLAKYISGVYSKEMYIPL